MAELWQAPATRGWLMCRMYKTAVGELKVSSCVMCPAGSPKYTKERLGEGFPPKFVSKLSGHHCAKLGELMEGGGVMIPKRCPLPEVADDGRTRGFINIKGVDND